MLKCDKKPIIIFLIMINFFYGSDKMIENKMLTFFKVAELKNFTRAAKELSLTQPAVSHHILQLENELHATLFIRNKGNLRMTQEGEIVYKYAKMMQSIDQKMTEELLNPSQCLKKIRVGITHTAESNMMTEVFAKCVNDIDKLSITIVTDTKKNLYDRLSNYEIDMAVIEEKNTNAQFNALMLDTDYLVCVLSKNHYLANGAIITLNQLKKEKMILRLPSSATRELFESTLATINESIHSFNVTLEVDNIETIKELVQKNLGVSILPRSACIKDLQQNKIKILQIENLSMARETDIIYRKDFAYEDILQHITRSYQEILKNYN